MKNIFIAYFLIASLSTFAQKQKEQSYIVSGQVKGAANLNVYLAGKSIYAPLRDSTIVDANGNFSFKGSVSEPQPVTLFFRDKKDKKGECEFILENTTIKLVGDVANLSRTKMPSSEDQRIYEEYQAEKLNFAKYRDQIQLPISEMIAKKDTVGAKSATMKGFSALKDSVNKVYLKFVNRYPSSAVAVFFMSSLEITLPVTKADSLMALVEKTPAGRYPAATKIRQKINTKLSSQPGAILKDFAQPDSTGKSVRLSDFKGKYVFVDFWASWCAPCRAENPNVLKAYHEFKNKNFTVIGVSLDGSRSAWLKAIKQDGLPWLQLSDLKGWENEAGKLYGLTAIPANFLIDPSGKIIAVNLRGGGLEVALEKAINESK